MLNIPHSPTGAPGSWVVRRLELLLQNSPKCTQGLFLFETILLLSPATPYKEGPVLLHSSPLWLDQECPGQGSTETNSQVSPAGVHGLPCVYHTSSLFPSLQPEATRPLLVLLNPSLAGEGAVNCSVPVVLWQAGRGWAWDCSCPGPCASLRDLFVLKQSPYRLFFQCPQYFLVSYLHKLWGAVGCSLCSSVDGVGVSPVCRGK